jgi:transcriptional regulator with XRE-family HTH domain
MSTGASGTFGVRLRSLREAAGFTQEELATIAGLSVHAVSFVLAKRDSFFRPMASMALKKIRGLSYGGVGGVLYFWKTADIK